MQKIDITDIHFEKDWRRFYFSWLYSWILAFIPSLTVYLFTKMTAYSIEPNGVLEYKHGIINQSYTDIDLYHVRNASAEINLITGGSVFITDVNGTQYTLPFIKNANEVAVKLRSHINYQRQQQGVRPLEMM